jgi:hypothetical protein
MLAEMSLANSARCSCPGPAGHDRSISVRQQAQERGARPDGSLRRPLVEPGELDPVAVGAQLEIGVGESRASARRHTRSHTSIAIVA